MQADFSIRAAVPADTALIPSFKKSRNMGICTTRLSNGGFIEKVYF